MTRTIQTGLYRSGLTAVLLQWSLRAIGLVSVLVLARLLTPADFGMIGIAMATVAVVEILGAIGLRQALLRIQEPSRAHLDTAWTIQLILFSGLSLLTLASAPLAAWAYGDPGLVPVIAILALRFLFLGLVNIGIVNFERDLRFGADMRMRVVARLGSFLLTVGAALLLRNYWALVVGLVAQTMALAIGSYIAHPYRPRLCLQERAALLGFSLWMLITAMAQTAQQQVERLVAAAFGGAYLAGLYSVSKDLSEIFTQEIATALNRVTFVTIASSGEPLHQDPARIARTLGLYAMIAAPLGLGLSATAGDSIMLLLGPQWIEAAPLLKIVAVYSAVYAVYRLTASALTAAGFARQSATLSIAGAGLMSLMTVAAGIWSGNALVVANAALIANLLLLASGITALARQARTGIAYLAIQVARPFAAAAAMYWAITWLPTDFASPFAKLLVFVTAGAAIYAASLLAIWAASGAPDGAEARALKLLLAEVRKLRSSHQLRSNSLG